MPWLEPVTLKGGRLRMEPVRPELYSGLYESADGATFDYFSSTPKPWDPEGFGDWVMTRTSEPFLCMAMLDMASGRVIGSSTFFDASEKHRHLEIGYTWIAPEMRGTWVNPESKLLMLTHAFETLGVIRVQIKCDNKNERSKAAILKLGAKFEGVLRNNMLLEGDYRRHTAYFSVLPEEWPVIKAGLVERIKNFS